MQIKLYSRAERERLHPAGSAMAFGGSCYRSPEAAADARGIGAKYNRIGGNAVGGERAAEPTMSHRWL